MLSVTKEYQKTETISDRENVRYQLQEAFPELKEEMDRVQKDKDESQRACYGTR